MPASVQYAINNSCPTGRQIKKQQVIYYSEKYARKQYPFGLLENKREKMQFFFLSFCHIISKKQSTDKNHALESELVG